MFEFQNDASLRHFYVEKLKGSHLDDGFQRSSNQNEDDDVKIFNRLMFAELWKR